MDTPYGALVGLSGPLPPPMPSHAESLIPLLANTLGALAGAESAVAAGVRRMERADATLDALTGTATRQAWELQLSRDDERCNTNGEQAWIFMICLDELHELNKRQGHEAGDELLYEFGKLLTATHRQPTLLRTNHGHAVRRACRRHLRERGDGVGDAAPPDTERRRASLRGSASAVACRASASGQHSTRPRRRSPRHGLL